MFRSTSYASNRNTRSEVNRQTETKIVYNKCVTILDKRAGREDKRDVRITIEITTEFSPLYKQFLLLQLFDDNDPVFTLGRKITEADCGRRMLDVNGYYKEFSQQLDDCIKQKNSKYLVLSDPDGSTTSHDGQKYFLKVIVGENNDGNITWKMTVKEPDEVRMRSHLEDQINKLTAKAVSLEEDLGTIREKIVITTENLEIKSKALNDLQGKFSDVQNESNLSIKEEISQEKEKMKQGLKDKENEYELDKQEVRDQYEKILSELENQKTDLEVKTKDLDEKIAKKIESGEYETESNNLTEQINKLREDTIKLKSKNGDLSERLEITGYDLKTSMRMSEKTIGDWQKKIELAKTHVLERYDASISSLELQNPDLSAKVQNLNEKNQKIEPELKKLRDEIEEQYKSYPKLKREITFLRDQKQQFHTELLEVNKELTSELEGLKRKLEKKVKTLKEKQYEYDVVREEKTILAEKLRIAQRDFNLTNSSLEEVTTEITDVIKEKDRRNRKAEELSHEIENRIEEINKQKSLIIDKSVKEQYLTFEIDDLQHKMRILEVEVEFLRERIIAEKEAVQTRERNINTNEEEIHQLKMKINKGPSESSGPSCDTTHKIPRPSKVKKQNIVSDLPQQPSSTVELKPTLVVDATHWEPTAEMTFRGDLPTTPDCEVIMGGTKVIRLSHGMAEVQSFNASAKPKAE